MANPLVLSTFLYEFVVDLSERNYTEENVFVVGGYYTGNFSLEGTILCAFEFAYVEERGTTIAVNRSYFTFQSFTRDLGNGFSLSHLLVSVITLLRYSN